MAVRYTGGLPNNIPRKIDNKRVRTKFFPEDLIANGRNFYIRIGFVDYSIGLSNFFGGQSGIPAGSIFLPIPTSLEDVQILSWEQSDVVSEIEKFGSGKGLGGAAASAISGFYRAVNTFSVGTGKAPNPGLFMAFRQPNFKEYTFRWDLVANNSNETDRIAEIVDELKFQSSPFQTTGFYSYPRIAIMRLYPNDKYTFRMKPAAITSVQVQYNGAGQPAFLRNGAPVNVKLAATFKEIQIWEKGSWGASSG